ncbi:MAG TPA: SLC13 family permease [Rhodanobacteraceae bacterium]
MSVFTHLKQDLAHLRREPLLALFALLALVLALADPHPAGAWLQWLNVPTLAGLTGLMMAIAGIQDSGLVQHGARWWLARGHSTRTMALTLVMASAALATVLTNDVSLFLIVPLTLALGGDGRLPLGRLVILEAFAVNAGSTLSPIGNPQNLLLWQASGLDFVAYLRAMAPAALIMLGLTLLLAWWWISAKATPRVSSIAVPSLHRGLGLGSIAALAGMVLALEYGHPLMGVGALLIVFALGRPVILRRVDWWLLATFAAIFLALGHLSVWPPLLGWLTRLHLDDPTSLYLTGILGSQLISNVPASVLLVHHTPLTTTLAIAANVGGYGCVIGSLANLIALRLARGEVTMAQFHRASLPFLLLVGVLVYLTL